RGGAVRGAGAVDRQSGGDTESGRGGLDGCRAGGCAGDRRPGGRERCAEGLASAAERAWRALGTARASGGSSAGAGHRRAAGRQRAGGPPAAEEGGPAGGGTVILPPHRLPVLVVPLTPWPPGSAPLTAPSR